MTKIEETRRAMYDALAKLKTNPRSKVVMGSFESAMEAHLEELRAKIANQAVDFIEMRQERDDCQSRMRAIDEAYRKSQEALFVAGDELRAAQTNVRHWRDECGKLDSTLRAFQSGDVYKQYLRDRHDLMAAEKLSDDLSDKLRDAQAVIGRQEQLIAGQRKAIADMHNELTHRRVICKEFMDARQSFVALDLALHDSDQSRAIRVLGDDIGVEVPF